LTRHPRGLSELVLPTRGTVVITGGSGDVAAVLARHLVDHHGVEHVVLLSRSGAGPAEVGRLVSCDVTDRDAVAAVLADLESPLIGVIHAAGVLDDATIESLTTEQLERVWAPKVEGARVLDELTRDMNLSFFVLFSSIAGVLGTAGQANYAAANAALDAVALYRRRAGHAATSLAWGPWSTGMASRLAAVDLARWERLGITPMDTGTALGLFDIALACDETTLVPAKIEAHRLRGGAVPEMLTGLVPALTAPPTGLDARLAGLDESARHTAIVDLIGEHVGVLTDTHTAIDPSSSFTDLGLDSLGAVELRNHLTHATGQRLPSTLIFDYPTPHDVARHIMSGLQAPSGPSGLTRIDSALEQIEALLATLSDEERQTAHRTMGKFDARVRAGLATNRHAAAPLDSASDEELFGLIDDEFGPR
jgi:NAD(P)-dependent dehydrogenase (short-subunit alcohol dehydrogenase family)/acyl carrier protein